MADAEEIKTVIQAVRMWINYCAYVTVGGDSFMNQEVLEEEATTFALEERVKEL